MAEGLSYLIWGPGRGYVSEKNLALDCVEMRGCAHPGASSLPPLGSGLGGWWSTSHPLSLSRETCPSWQL